MASVLVKHHFVLALIKCRYVPFQSFLLKSCVPTFCRVFSAKSFNTSEFSVEGSHHGNSFELDDSLTVAKRVKETSEFKHKLTRDFTHLAESAGACLHPILEIREWDEKLLQSLCSEYKRILPKATDQVVEHSILALCKKKLVSRPARLLLENRATSSPPVPVATLALYIELCGLCHAKQLKLGASAEENASEILDSMLKVFEQLTGRGSLDHVSFVRVVNGLCAAGQWLKALQCRRTWPGDSYAVTFDFNRIVEAAFLSGDRATACEVVDEMTRDWRFVSHSALIQWLTNIEQLAFEDARSDILGHVTAAEGQPTPGRRPEAAGAAAALRSAQGRRLPSEEAFAEFMRHVLRINIPVDTDLASRILSLCTRKLPRPWQGMASFVSHSGVCEHCGYTLPESLLTDQEFAELREAFLSRVLIGDDVFLKSNPGELSRFRSFVERNAPFDHVVDGLNVAHCINDRHRRPNMLVQFVNHLSNLAAENMLIVARRSLVYDKQVSSFVRSKAHVFVVENGSNDDSLMLFAMLSSNQRTRLYTRDFLRDHVKHLTPQQTHNFNRLMRRNRVPMLHVRANRSFQLETPYRHDLSAHHDGNGLWHVPFQGMGNRFYTHNVAPFTDYKFNNRWLCLREPRD